MLVHRIASLLFFSLITPMQMATAQPMVIEYRSGLTVEIKNNSQMCTAVATMGTNVLTRARYRSQLVGVTRGCHLPTLESFTTNALEVSIQ
jgi:hypothetical protein